MRLALRSLGGLIWVVCGFAAVPAFASTITYNLTDVHTSDGFLTFTGSFTIDSDTDALGSLVSFDIMAGNIEWTPANTFSTSGSSQSLSVSTCTPVRVNCYGSLARVYTLWLGWGGNGSAHGVFDVTFPGDSAEFQYTVSGSVGQAQPVMLSAVHNPEPGTLWMLAVACVMMLATARRVSLQHRTGV